MSGEYKTLKEYDGIAIGDYVNTKSKYGSGFVESIIDFGTHICYYMNVGMPLKLPMKREWIELAKKSSAPLKIKTIEQTCWGCPSQWDIITKEGQYIYARFRWGHLSVKLNPFTDNEKILFEWDDEDNWNGVMSTDELQKLTKEIFDWNDVEYK